MKILITAFDPFNGEIINPSEKLIKSLPSNIHGCEIVTTTLPTVFKKSREVLYNKIDSLNPDAVICLGQAGNRAGLTIERVGINIDDAPIDDNEGNRPIDAPIFSDGESAYFTNLPIKRVVMEVKKEGIPISVSNSAGTFVCNHILYSLLYKIGRDGSEIKGGFIHIPFIPEQCLERPTSPSMSLSDMKRGLIKVIEIIAQGEKELKISGGVIS